jgi:hypothetical protein
MRKKCCPKRKKDGTRIPSFLIYHVLRKYGRINKIGLHLIKETASGDIVSTAISFFERVLWRS